MCSCGSGVRFRERFNRSSKLHECKRPRRLPSDRSLVQRQRLAEARHQSAKGVPKIKAERRVGSLGGMAQEPKCALLTMEKANKTRTNLQHPLGAYFNPLEACISPRTTPKDVPELRSGC